MAIKNASDLLVYKKTTPAQPQITRIKVKSSTPIKDFTSGQDIKVNNITDASGDISDGVAVNLFSNTGNQVVFRVGEELSTNHGYNITGQVVDGSFTYIDVTNGANGPVPTLELVDFEAEFKAGAVEIVVLQSGQSLVYQPIAYSTSASLGVSKDLRDITTKDSQGWQENAKGLGSFELSTDALWDVNNAVGVEAATEDLIVGDSVDVKFSDRVVNLVDTEEVYGSGWNIQGAITQTKHLEDPFGQFTAAKLAINSSTAYAVSSYLMPISLVEGKKITFSFYLKKSGTSGTAATFDANLVNGAGANNSLVRDKYSVLEGSGTISSAGGQSLKITGLTTNWTRVSVNYTTVSGTDLRSVKFNLNPGANAAAQTTADEVITASWQVETGTSATDYQNPTEVDCYQGKAFVNSVSVDAGTEENATYSASFTGTSEIFINGLGHELIADPYFDDGTNWWSVAGAAYITSGVVRILWSTGTPSEVISPTIITSGEKYCLEYTVSNYNSGGLKIAGLEVSIPSTVGSHKIHFTPTGNNLIIKRDGDFATTDINITFISVKQVFC